MKKYVYQKFQNDRKLFVYILNMHLEVELTHCKFSPLRSTDNV